MTNYKNMFKGYGKLKVYEHKLLISSYNIRVLLIGYEILHLVIWEA